MAFTFPTTPTNGQTFVQGGVTFTYTTATDTWVGAAGSSGPTTGVITGTAAYDYQVAALAPILRSGGAALVDGDLWFDTTANTLKTRKTGAWQAPSSSTSTIRRHSFSASGSYVPSTNCKGFIAFVGGATSGIPAVFKGGCAGGGFALKVYSGVLAASYPIVIGAVGAPGLQGGTTTFNGTISITAPSVQADNNSGQVAGTVSGGDFNAAGGNGGNALNTPSRMGGGGGGGGLAGPGGRGGDAAGLLGGGGGGTAGAASGATGGPAATTPTSAVSGFGILPVAGDYMAFTAGSTAIDDTAAGGASGVAVTAINGMTVPGGAGGSKGVLNATSTGGNANGSVTIWEIF